MPSTFSSSPFLADRAWTLAARTTPEQTDRVQMTITMLYVFVPGALWGFVVMPWYGWTALAGVCLGGLVYLRRGPREGSRRRSRHVAIAATLLGVFCFGAAVVLGEYGCSHGPPDGFCMSGGFPLLAATCVVWFFAGIAVVTYCRAARNL